MDCNVDQSKSLHYSRVWVGLRYPSDTQRALWKWTRVRAKWVGRDQTGIVWTTRSCGVNEIRHKICHLDESALVLGCWAWPSVSWTRRRCGKGHVDISGIRDLSAAVSRCSPENCAHNLYAHVFLFVNVGPIFLLITLYLVVFGNVAWLDRSFLYSGVLVCHLVAHFITDALIHAFVDFSL